MNFLRRSLAIFAVAARRLFSQRGLALATSIGLIASVAIVMSIPLYTDAVYYRILQDELTNASGGDETSMQRPPFAFMFRYIGSLYGLKEWQDVEQVDTYLSGPGAEALGLPIKQQVRYARTDNFRLFSANEAAYADVRDPLEWISFAFASDFEKHITLLEGAFPAPADSNPDTPIQILITDAFANELGLQVGEELVAFRNVESETGNRTVQMPLQISGIWVASDPAEEYWFYRQSVFETQFFVPEATFQARMTPQLTDEVAQMLWYIILDGDNVTSDDVGWLLNHISTVQQQAATLLTNTRLEVSPQDALQRYRRSSILLNVLLYAFSIPIVGLLLAFIGLVVGLAVNRQRNEIAVLRSRGATAMQILGIAALEAAILGTVALLAGIPVSEQIARVIGATRSFLNFTVENDLRIDMTLSTLRFGLAAIGVTLVAQILPSTGASRYTIVTFKQEQARTIRPPWWQRAWLDVLLLIPVIYGTYLLQQQGSITAPGVEGLSDGPFNNPLLFLIPALGALAMTLLVLRILPVLMTFIAWIASRTTSVGFLLATRYLARDPGFYTAPLVLLVLTLSLSTFTASLARTLDNHLFDQLYYRNGSDLWLVELGSVDDAAATDTTGAAPAEAGGATAAASTGTDAESAVAEARWVFIPVDEHLKAPGFEAATRVGDFEARIQAQGAWQEAKFIGIDRVDFPKAAFWRRDFAPASLGALMNALAVAPDGVLLPGKYMRENAIRVGDSVIASVSTYGSRAQMTLTVVGEFRYFPTWYAEEQGPLMVGNLDHLFEQMRGEFPYDVWAKTAPGLNSDQMLTDLRNLDFSVLNWRSARLNIAAEQKLPQRQGLFGVLSVGFLAAALLTVLGFLLYALFSFRRRFIELGTLRAIGLSSGQMTTFLAWELMFLIILGLGAGTLLGTIMSQVYIPYLQVGSTAASLTPPFVVEIAWDAIMRIYALFGILFFVALVVLAVLLLRMKIFQAIKLGETV
ncbi:MAG: ABC transporter permease [Caldilineaceae bacterium]|nr:ABC transporter permease [Caldilineaceae bacterium]